MPLAPQLTDTLAYIGESNGKSVGLDDMLSFIFYSESLRTAASKNRFK